MSMSAAQYLKLSAIQSKLFDVLAVEADPDNWPGAGMLSKAMDRATRGDSYWAKRNAAATMSLIQRAQSIFKSELDNVRRRIGVDEDDETVQLPEVAEITPSFDLDKDIASFEKQAMTAIQSAARRSGAG